MVLTGLTWGVLGVAGVPRESSDGPDVELVFFLLGEALYGDLWGLGEAIRGQRQDSGGSEVMQG